MVRQSAFYATRRAQDSNTPQGDGHAAIDLRRGLVKIDDATDRSSRYVLLCEDAALSFRS